MKPFKPRFISSIIFLSLSPLVLADHITLPAISVEGVSSEAVPYALPDAAIHSPDTAQLLKKMPGANVNQNGPLTGIAQYRGLFGDRVNVLIDGVHISTAGPNAMDAPLSYLPSPQLDNISLYRGIAPVRTGIETLGGTISATSKQPEFTASKEFEFHGYTNLGYAENGQSYYGSTLLNLANDHHIFHLAGSTERGNDDLEFDGGDIFPTEHERDTYSAGYAYQNDNQRYRLQGSHHDTGKTGTPALPMDIIYAKGDHYSGHFSHDFSDGSQFNAQLSYQDSEHLMANYVMRTRLTRLRYALTDVKSNRFSMSYKFSDWLVGFDADRADHNANIFDPNNALFFINNFKDIERDRYSIFAEKQFNFNKWAIETGLRYSRVDMDAGQVNSSMAGMAAVTLRNNFNNADRDQDENLVDLVINSRYQLTSDLDLIAGFARKERAPSYQQRYLWLPMQATSGLADGNNYMGNIDLDKETAYQLELGLDWHSNKATLSPHIFYHRINDYIQGTPSTNMTANMVSTMMGSTNTPLQFNNVDAELYGLDTNWSYVISPAWQLDGVVSYVRGQRRDTDDNLYRIAPLSARTMISYVAATWTVGFEAETVAAQNKVSAENREQKTSGYTLFNLSGNYRPTDKIILSAGINNLFDRDYDNHLAGYNRITDNPDIAQGDRLPGVGRSAYVNMNINW